MSLRLPLLLVALVLLSTSFTYAQTDCLGVVGGGAVADVCSVCNGDGTSCQDCLGVPFGRATYDECDVCGGDNTACCDCAGVPNGDAAFDACGVCGGDGTSCIDCSASCFNLARCYFPSLFTKKGNQKYHLIPEPAKKCLNC